MSTIPTHVEEFLTLQNLQLVARSPLMHMPEVYYHEIPFLDHPLDGPNEFIDTHHGKCTSQGTFHEPQDFKNSNFYVE